MEIEFNNVSYSYDTKNVLDQISTKIKKQKINMIIGPSGSGKTTFIELINALLEPTSGSIKIDDFLLQKGHKIKNINKLRFDIGLVFQFPEEQFFQTTVNKEIAFGMEYFKYKINDIEKRVKEALYLVGLDDSFLERNPFLLSSGEQRKVAIASILVFNPKVIILDEPTVGLDNKSRKELIKLLIKLKNRHNKTIIVVGHDIDYFYPIVDNYIVLNKGKLIKTGTRNEIFNDLKLLENNHINIPKIVQFIKKVEETKGIKLGDEDNILDLMKAVYRNV